LYSFCGVLGSDSSSMHSWLAGPLAVALLLESLLLHTTLLLLQQLQLPLLFFSLTSLSLADLAQQPESSTTVVQILALQVKMFAAILALLFVIKSLL
jgi:hypothetical protein